MEHFYEVIAKCGHVGRNQYYEGHFYEKAESKSEAASIVRMRRRVKHDHADAIISVVEIIGSQYFEGIKSKENEAYFNCNSRYEQNAVLNEIIPFLRPEPRTVAVKPRKQEAKHNVYNGKEKIRKPSKYIKLNPLTYDFDFELIGA